MAEPSNKTQRQDWIDLPEEITAFILSRLGAIETLVTAVYVCTTWRRIWKDPRKWLTIDMRDDSVYGESPSGYPMDKLCRKAIDLSCGNLVDISVHNFCSDEVYPTPWITMAEPSNKTQREDWINLPEEITASILSRLGAIEILVTAVYVCTTWRKICMDPRKWLTIDMRDDSVYGESPSSTSVCSVHHFCSDDLLTYITDSCRGIKRLCSVFSDITNNGRIEAAPKLPLQEELELSHCKYRFDIPYFEDPPQGNLEVIGRFCPLLKSLKLNRHNTKMFFVGWDGDALAIAETMHGLHHLQLFGNKLTSNGLRAILDGCPLLESLDLRHCWHINLDRECLHHFGLKPDEELKRRCIDHIKNLRLPHDSKHDYERLAARNLVHKEFLKEL